MLPITDFLSCTEPIDEFESLSSEQQHHAKTYTRGLVAHWHLQMLAYSLLRLGPESSASGTLCSKASSIQVQLEYALKEVVYNLFPWVRDHPKPALDELMEEIDHLLLHSDSSDGSNGWYL